MNSIRISFLCVAVTVGVLVGPTGAATAADNPAPPDKDAVPLIVMDNVPLADAIRNLARQAALNYILDPRLLASSGPFVSGRWTNLSARAVLGALLKDHKLTMVTNPATTVTRIAPASLDVKPVPASQVGTNKGSAIPLIVMDDTLLTEAITKLAGAAQLKVSLDPKWAAPSDKARATVSFRLENITARQALASLLDNYELTLIEDAAGSPARITLKAPLATDTAEPSNPKRKQP